MCTLQTWGVSAFKWLCQDQFVDELCFPGLKKKSVTPKTLPQCTSTESNLRDRILSEVKKNTVIALPGKGGQNRFMPSKLCVPRTWVVVQLLRLHLPMQGVRVRSVVRELRFHMPHGQRTRTWKKSNIITNSIKNFFRKKNCVSQPRGFGEESYDEHGSMVGLPITIKLCAGPAVL